MRFCPRCGTRYEHERFCPEDGAATEPLPSAGPPRDALIGALIDGRYRIEAQIGEGGMGVVYRAKHEALNKTIALKVLRGEMAKDAEVVQRFMQEAQAATSIGHENIIDISDFGQLADGTAYFVMEHLGGRPLSELVKRGGSIPTADAVSILKQIAGALGAAHARGIVHRDLKPDNVIVLPRGEISHFVKVLDFGIAKVGSKNKLTRTGMVFGTPHYMSPEQAAGQTVDARTDIYALGVIMYEMFTGRVPFDADTFMGVLTKHMFEKPAPMFGDNSGRQLGALEQITLRALEKKPENRYASMQDMISDLEHVVGGGRPRAATPGHRTSAELADALEPRTKSELRLDQRLSGSTDDPPGLPLQRRGLWLATSAALVVVLGGGLWFFLRGAEPNVARESSPSVPSLPQLPATTDTAAKTEAPTRVAEPDTLADVELDSTPSGAEVILNGAVIGRTPARLPRPAKGVRGVELRLDGYARGSVHLKPDSPSSLNVMLSKQTVQKKPKATPVKPPEPAKPGRRRLGSEVVDPWGE